jgi:S-adenosylmethionine:tRNA ribosyltransferase-isomerase
MKLDAFDFDIPENLIALRPITPREQARMLVIDPAGRIGPQAGWADRQVADFPQFLQAGDCLVVNDTRVIPARLAAVRRGRGQGARIDVTLHKRESGDQWLAFARPAKKLVVGDCLDFLVLSDAEPQTAAEDLSALVLEKKEGGEILLRFTQADLALDAALQHYGTMPLPPYIAARRSEDAGDLTDFQTVFAQKQGAVAAPTAGLHFTPALLDQIRAKGVNILTVTLHVGAGTFLPVKVEEISQHKMHAEWGEIDAQTADQLNRCRKAGGRIVAVGTTSLRVLESAVQPDGRFVPFSQDTAIFITPGYRFKAVDVLFSNFHLPRSTLFMLVCAFAGLDFMQAAYRHAMGEGYRFYSYGDACLLFRAPDNGMSGA